MTTTTVDDDQMYANNGGVVPVFSGAMEDYAAWREDAMDWEFSTKFPDKIKATKLVLAQNEMVKKVMRQIGGEKVRSADGFKLVMKEMDQTFTLPTEQLGLNSFEKWDTMTRSKGQSSEAFLMQYDVAFHDLMKHDSRVSMSDQLLVMKGLSRLQIDDKDKTQILSRMKDPVNIHKLISTIKSIYGQSDVPWIGPKGAKSNDITDSALINREMFDSAQECHDQPDDEAYSYWVKSKGAGKGKNNNRNTAHTAKCERCGYPGHPARDCKISWERIEAKRHSSSELCGAFIALCPNCGHPDCEGPGSDSDNSSTISYRSTHEFNF